VSDAPADLDDACREFTDAVNMTPAALKKWLDTDASTSVGQKKDGPESVGHESGRRVVRLLEADKRDLSADDVAHMKKVAGSAERLSRRRLTPAPAPAST